MPSTQQHLRQLYRAARGLAFHARTPGKLHKAALRAEFTGDFEGACALWFEQRGVLTGAPLAKVEQSLAACALRSAREAEATQRWTAALQSWEYLRAVEPESEPAAKGIDRAAQRLAIELDGQFGEAPADDALALKPPLHRLPQFWKVDVLVRLGRAQEARDRLAALESELGASATSRKLAAQIALHAGQSVQAVAAACEAIELAQRTARRQSPECPLICAEALCDRGLHNEARDMLFAHMRNRDAPTDREFAALFATARTRSEVDAIRAFLEPHFAAGHKSRSSARKQHSIALRDLGFSQEARDIVRSRLLEEMAEPFGHAPRPANGAWSLAAERALLDLKTDLDAGGFAFFLISGTLLGCMREGRLLGHDKDIDVGIPADVDMDALRAHLRSTGRFRVRPLPVQTVVRAIHANGTSIDLFRHWLEDGQMVHQGQKAKWTNTPFALKPQDFLGATFQVPSDPERYLAENYADWKTPAKDFDTVVDTPNMTVTDREHLIWYCYTGLQISHAWGSANRFAKLWALLQRTAPPDDEVASAIAAQLAGPGGQDESP
ncbi:MAG: hypothetical protein WBQ17_17110 [Rhizomicrobium sp.]